MSRGGDRKSERPSRPTGDSEDNTDHHSCFSTTSDAYAHDVYRSLLDDLEVRDFLESSSEYNSENEKWDIPQHATTQDLVDSVCKVVRSIMERFVKPVRPEVKRTIVNMHHARGNDVKNEEGYYPCPALVVQATGPSFEDPTPTLAVKRDEELGSAKEDVKETEAYAKVIFALQPNRIYVRSLVLTQTHARLIHVDRAGTQVTPLLDIHHDPATFIRLIIGLASVDEQILGLDDSIQWTIVEGRKAEGRLTTTGPTGEIKTYPIIEYIPVPRETVRGRGTACWRVRDPDTDEELIVKDSWRPDNRPPEHEFLELVKSVPGVVQMVSYEAQRWETKDFRCPSTAGHYQNRIGTRVTMKSYGKPIEFFTSVLQLLRACRDAIAGHQRLASEEVRILHRDVSHNNILLGKEDASEGNRGVLIDFDTAFRATDEQPTVAADPNVGTRIFQSLSVLGSSYRRDAPPMHDYLDDLESFFLVLTYIFLFRKPDGSFFPTKSTGPSIVRKWEDPNPNAARYNKSAIFGGTADSFDAVDLIEESWGPICLKLFKDFRSWTSDVGEMKARLLKEARESKNLDDDDDEDDEDVEDGDEDVDESTPLDPLESLHSRRDDHYAEVLGFFDQAISALEVAPTGPIPACKPVPSAAEKAEPPAVPPPEDGGPAKMMGDGVGGMRRRREREQRREQHTVSEPHNHIIPRTLQLPNPTPPIDENVIAFLLVPINHLLRSYVSFISTRPLIKFDPTPGRAFPSPPLVHLTPKGSLNQPQQRAEAPKQAIASSKAPIAAPEVEEESKKRETPRRLRACEGSRTLCIGDSAPESLVVHVRLAAPVGDPAPGAYASYVSVSELAL
ncbi:hypothetical protein NMY22_g17896 [Coprinellus aureogranulatus]|nr:hypothetical protein NMY22_g17896 [Coprinellus aureogranulatus]